MIRTLVADLKQLQRDHGLRPDLIFFTGDLGWGQIGTKDGEQLSDQFTEGHKFLEAARTAFDPPIPIENVFLVPGNHDIDRGAATPQLTSWLEKGATAELVNEMLRAGGTEWHQYATRLEQYRKFLERSGYTHLLADPGRLLYTAVRQIAGRAVGIAGFNSAWSCSRDKEKGKLWLGARWQVETLAAALSTSDIKVALVHHPGGWIVEEESNCFWRFGLEGQFDVRLHGHEHESWADEVNGTLTVSAGACYERQDRPNGYNFARFFPNKKYGEVWFRKFDARGGAWGPDFIAGKTNAYGVKPLEGLKWLKPDSRLEDAETVASGGANALPMTSDAIRAKVELVTKAVEAAFGGRAELKIEGDVADFTSLPMTVARANRPPTALIQQIVVINIVFPGGASPSTGDAVGSTDVPDRLKTQFERIDNLISTFRIRDAQTALDKLLDEHRDDLTPRERFRAHVKTGHIHYARRDLKLAAATYRAATTYVDQATSTRGTSLRLRRKWRTTGRTATFARSSLSLIFRILRLHPSFHFGFGPRLSTKR